MTTTQFDTQLAPAPAVRAWGRLMTDTRYVLTGFPLAIVAFSVGLTGFAAGLGLAVVWVGVPLLAVTMLWARGFAVAERARVASVLGAALPAPQYRTAEHARVASVLGAALSAPQYRTAEHARLDYAAVLTATATSPAAGTTDRAARLPARMFAVLLDPQSWRDLAHAVVRFVPSTIGFSFVATWWAGALGGLTWSLWGWALPKDDVELPELLGFGDRYGTIVVFYLVVGALFALTLPAVTQWAARFEARVAQALL